MTGYEHTVFTTRVGSIVGTGFGCPRCFRVLDGSGVGITREPRVDLRTAFRTLARMHGVSYAVGARSRRPTRCQMKNLPLDSLASPRYMATPPNSTPSISSSSCRPSRSIVIVHATSRTPAP